MENIQLTKNFSLKELIEGTALPPSAVKLNYEYFDKSKLSDLVTLAESLQFIRDCTKEKFGNSFKGFRVTAGLRVVQWELKKGRSGNSQHPKYKAADIQPICSTKHYDEIFNWIFETFNETWKGGFAQKKPDLKSGKLGFIHVDNRNKKARWEY